MAEKVTLTRINIFDSAKSFKDNEAQITDNELNLIKCGAVVTETWKSEDGSCWYRLWSDGWIEQGGVIDFTVTKVSGGKFEYTIPYAFSNTDYVLNLDWRANDNDTGGYGEVHVAINGNAPYDYGQTVNSFRCSAINLFAKVNWKASGY